VHADIDTYIHIYICVFVGDNYSHIPVFIWQAYVARRRAANKLPFLTRMKSKLGMLQGVGVAGCCSMFLIQIAFITGNSSLEPLIEGLCAQIHVNLS